MPKRDLRIKNWDKWQSYRKDRGTPPWIKVHRSLMRNPEWVCLSDSERGQLVSIWMLAADNDGELISDPALIQKLCFLSSKPNINKFIELSFMETIGCHDDANMTPTRRQGDAPDKNREETEEIREEADTGAGVKPPTNREMAREILVFLNEKAGKSFKPVDTNLDFIIERLKEGYEPREFRQVIAKKVREWKGDEKMSKFLRPETLFNKTKFASYTGELVVEVAHG